jgi:hypothetical protein
MGYYRDQIDVIVPHGCGYLVRGFALDNHWLDFQSLAERIAEQIFYLTANLAEPLRFLIFREALRYRH